MTLLEDRDGAIGSRFPDEPFTLAHGLAGHELFELEPLLDLARTLPDEQVEWNAGNAGISQDPDTTPANGLSAQETVASIEENASWLVMKNVQSHPDYARILHECLAEVESIAGTRLSGLGDRAGFVFLSSSGSITPYHMDPEHNFLLQLRGTKTLHVFDQRDREVVSEEEIERTYYGPGRHRNLEIRDASRHEGTRVVLMPGEGVHIPIHAPHWVENGDGVSVSFSITFRSDRSRRAVRLHALNARLRRLGLRPSDVGARPRRDEALDLLLRRGLAAKRWLSNRDRAA